jgi:hypothetical protein
MKVSRSRETLQSLRDFGRVALGVESRKSNFKMIDCALHKVDTSSAEN